MGALRVWFNCCVTEQPQPTRRRRLDPSMIGLPQDFRHTAHIGSRDVGNNTVIDNIQTQMKSKGGYDYVTDVDVKLNVECIDLSYVNNR